MKWKASERELEGEDFFPSASRLPNPALLGERLPISPTALTVDLQCSLWRGQETGHSQRHS